MPTWKIKGYWFYFKVIDLFNNKPAHVHVEVSRGEIQFWLEKTDEKSEDKIKVKKIKGNISKNEQSKIERIVKDNLDFFLKEWKEQKAKVK